MDIYAITNEMGESLSRLEIIQKLEEMGIDEEVIRSGDSSAILEDAASKGISSIQIESALEPKIVGAGDKVQEEYQNQLRAKGIPEAVLAQGASAVQTFATQNGLMLPQPPSGARLNVKS